MTSNTSKIAYYIQGLRRRGIPVLPPDVNESESKFSVGWQDGVKGVRFGLEAVKNLGHGVVEALVNERERGGPYADLYDFIDRNVGSQLNKKGVESLIRAGAFDRLPGTRRQKIVVFERAMDAAAKQQRSVLAGQVSLFDMGGEMKAPPPPMPDAGEYSFPDLLKMEHETTGVYISGHPLDEFAEKLAKLEMDTRLIAEFPERPDRGMSFDNRTVRMAGLIAGRKVKASKSGGIMCFVTLEDLYGSVEVLVFPKTYEALGPQLVTEEPVLMTGKLSVSEKDENTLDVRLLLEDVQLLREANLDAPVERPQRSNREGGARRKPLKSKLFLKLSPEQHDIVVPILAETPGNIPVVLVEIGEDGSRNVVRLEQNLWVDEGYDFFALANLLGPDSVVLQ